MCLGSSTLGEYFDPAYDCSDVVDRVPDAADGFYWIYPKEVKTVVKVCFLIKQLFHNNSYDILDDLIDRILINIS